jgi:hypothetical protein
VLSIQIYLVAPAVHAKHNSFIGWTPSQVVLELHIEPLHLLPIPADITWQPQLFIVFTGLLLQAGGRSRACWITVSGRSLPAAAFPKTPDLNHAGTI